MNNIYLLSVGDCPPADVFDRLLSLTSPERRERLRRMKLADKRWLSLCGDLLVRSIACRELGVSNDQLIFAVGEHGKPYLSSHPTFHYNVSHTQGIVAIAVSEKPVGVDVERIRPVPRRLPEGLFTPAECAYIGTSDTPESRQKFLEVWTRKEAYAKWTGKGVALSGKSADTFDPEISKMLKTKMGEGSALSVCGDLAEIMPGEKVSGFTENPLVILDQKQLFSMADALFTAQISHDATF